MKTKHPEPGLVVILQFVGYLCFVTVACLLFAYNVTTEKTLGGNPILPIYAIFFGFTGLMYLLIAKAIHQVLDFLYRSAEANEAMLELLERQNRMLAARENVPAVQPPVAKFYTITEPDTPPVKQAADELKSTCGHCSTQILFPREGVGQKVPCPVCGNAVLLAAN